MKKTVFIFCLSVFVFLNSPLLYSQQTKDYKANTLDKDKWKTLSEELDYTEEKKPKEKPQEYKHEEKSSGMDFSGLAPLFKVLGFILIIGIIGFILARLLPTLLYKNSAVVKSNIDIESEEELHEENIAEWPLQKLLNKYITDGDIRNAIRIYYLMSLQLLHLNGHIKWEKDKTNSKYILEFSSHPQASDFSNLTSIYETTWYGNFQLNESMFDVAKNQFLMFNNQFPLPDEK
ncbi:MAG: hypothetical protein ACTHJT_08430 [Cytophaga sp.]|uniref:hypothetical protein n=1 Tax=Cytophaga sp. TaxID=29535 RepID=UPI003F80275F